MTENERIELMLLRLYSNIEKNVSRSERVSRYELLLAIEQTANQYRQEQRTAFDNPPTVPSYPTLLEDRPSDICSKCGIDFSKTMGYVCSRLDCPIQPQVSSEISKTTGEN